MSFRYSLYPVSWYNSVYLYNAESLVWSGSQAVSSFTSLADKPSAWNISFSISDSSNSLIKMNQFSIGSLLVGEANFWNDTGNLQLFTGQTYKVTIRYLSSSGMGIPWPLLIDAVILMPDLTAISYYSMQSAFKQREIQECYLQSKQLPTMPTMAAVCRQHTFSISVIMYNGTLRKFHKLYNLLIIF